MNTSPHARPLGHQKRILHIIHGDGAINVPQGIAVMVGTGVVLLCIFGLSIPNK